MKTKDNIKKYLNKKGFTILETLVAIFILTISMTGPLAFAQSGLRAAYLARDQITAMYLAQDAIETIRNIRDQNELDCGSAPGADCSPEGNANNWLQGLYGCLIEGGTEPTRPCAMDTTYPDPTTAGSAGLRVSDCPSIEAGCDPLIFFHAGQHSGLFKLDSSGSADDWNESIFSRTIYIKEKEDEREAEVVVVVKWRNNSGLGDRQIIVQQNFFNWWPNDTGS